MNRSSGKVNHLLVGGPFGGKHVRLNMDGSTSWFTVKGVTGRYLKGRWENSNGN